MPDSDAGWRIEPPVSVPVAAGHEARRDRRRRAARAAAGHVVEVPRIAAPGRSTRSRSTSPSRTRPCWSCRRARCRRASSPSTTCASYGAMKFVEHARAAGRAQARGHEHVLVRDRDAGRAVRASPRASARVGRLRLRRARRRASTVMNALSSGRSRAMRVEASPRELDAGELALRAQRRGELGDGVGIVRATAYSIDLRHEIEPVLDRRRDALVAARAGRSR